MHINMEKTLASGRKKNRINMSTGQITPNKENLGPRLMENNQERIYVHVSPHSNNQDLKYN